MSLGSDSPCTPNKVALQATLQHQGKPPGNSGSVLLTKGIWHHFFVFAVLCIN